MFKREVTSFCCLFFFLEELVWGNASPSAPYPPSYESYDTARLGGTDIAMNVQALNNDMERSRESILRGRCRTRG